MGIRIHKMCGWGLGAVERKDERINWESWLWNNHRAEKKFAEYHEFIKERDTSEKYVLPNMEINPSYAFYESVNLVDQESSIDELLTLCVKPLWCTDWYRSDSILDWLECPDKEFLSVHTQWLTRGIHPWNSKYVDSRTNKPIPKDSNDFISFLWDDEREEAAELFLKPTLCEPLGITLEEARAVIVPALPDDIESVIDFTEIFVDEKTKFSLRPLVLTWWA